MTVLLLLANPSTPTPTPTPGVGRPDSGAILEALVAYLRADADLARMMPDGVWIDLAPPTSTKFVIVSIADAEDEATFEGRAIESVLVFVKAVARSVPPSEVRCAAYRLDQLLEDSPFGDVPGYEWMTTFRERRVGLVVDSDDVDRGVRWYHAGGYYRIEMAVGHLDDADAASMWTQPDWMQPEFSQ